MNSSDREFVEQVRGHVTAVDGGAFQIARTSLLRLCDLALRPSADPTPHRDIAAKGDGARHKFGPACALVCGECGLGRRSPDHNCICGDHQRITESETQFCTECSARGCKPFDAPKRENDGE